MMSDFFIRSTAAFGGTPFRLKKCTALGSAGSGATAGAEQFRRSGPGFRPIWAARI